jgi:uncharacterized protein
MKTQRPLAIVTGASTGIGFELAVLAARHGHDLVIAADETRIFDAGEQLRALGARVDVVQGDLATLDGNDRILLATQGRPVALLCANAGRGLGQAFLAQDFATARHVIDTNVTGTLYLIHRIGRAMKERGSGRILITGSIAGYVPGTYQAVYSGTKAMIDSFAIALRAELKGSGVTVTNLMPGLTETDFFRRAGLLGTKLGAAPKQPAKEVARIGYAAMLRGDARVIAGWKNKLQTFLAGLAPATFLAAQHASAAAPGSTAPARATPAGARR